MSHPEAFATSRDAKEYLVGRIVTQAQREYVPLSEVETKMLYFSETAWTLPDITEVNAAFDRDYDQVEYEEKIAGLIRRLYANARSNDRLEYDRWTEAVRKLQKEDHYILALIAEAGVLGRPPFDLLKLFATALAIVGAFVAFVLWSVRR